MLDFSSPVGGVELVGWRMTKLEHEKFLRWVYILFVVIFVAAVLFSVLQPMGVAAVDSRQLLSRPHLPSELVK
ncbi:MAG: hypothetical protein D6706_02105 [Chloroflexi bacterium]|nr:MAG: hypothetical protein D6706_02105 [Chloroflexota bacterium]